MKINENRSANTTASKNMYQEFERSLRNVEINVPALSTSGFRKSGGSDKEEKSIGKHLQAILVVV